MQEEKRKEKLTPFVPEGQSVFKLDPLFCAVLVYPTEGQLSRAA